MKVVRHIVWRAENSSTHEPLFTTADVHFEVLDPDSLTQNWGPEIAGIGVGLSIDRTTFTYGEQISLHLRWENFSASRRLGVTECGAPQPQVEVQDQTHRIIGVASFHDYGCMGHGWGPFAIEQGKRHREYVSLTSSKMGYMTSEGKALIARPGIYYLSAVWSPQVLLNKYSETELQGPGPQFTFGEQYATAHSLPVRIEIRAK